jgi:hypothetical protein
MSVIAFVLCETHITISIPDGINNIEYLLLIEEILWSCLK